MPLLIKLSGEDRLKYIREGIAFLQKYDSSIDYDDAESYVKQKLDECTNPEAYDWKACPIKMRDRFEVKMGMRASNKSGGLRRDVKSKIRKLTKKKMDMSIAHEILAIKKFDKNEEKFVKNLVIKYQTEFTFNETSDRNLLKNLVIEEIKLNELNIKYIDSTKDFTTYDVKVRESCQGNIFKLQQNLGITRQQRDAEMEKNQQSIAELSVTLEAKMGDMLEKEEIEIEEELGFFREKMEREPINIPLVKDEMEAALSSSDRDELSGDEIAFANEISRKAEERKQQLDKEEEKKEKKKEPVILPDPII